MTPKPRGGSANGARSSTNAYNPNRYYERLRRLQVEENMLQQLTSHMETTRRNLEKESSRLRTAKLQLESQQCANSEEPPSNAEERMDGGNGTENGNGVSDENVKMASA